MNASAVQMLLESQWGPYIANRLSVDQRLLADVLVGISRIINNSALLKFIMAQAEQYAHNGGTVAPCLARCLESEPPTTLQRPRDTAARTKEMLMCVLRQHARDNQVQLSNKQQADLQQIVVRTLKEQMPNHERQKRVRVRR